MKDERRMDGGQGADEIKRLDYVHNLTQEYVVNLMPHGECGLWDWDLIDDIVWRVWEVIKDRNVCTKDEFYPQRPREAREEK